MVDFDIDYDYDPLHIKKPERPTYIIGLDLGQKQDYTALAVLEKHGSGREAIFHCRHLKRYQLGTSYPAVISDVRELCLKEPLRHPWYPDRSPYLAIDSTGVGTAVTEMFTLARPSLKANIYPIVIHGGDQVVVESGIRRVPKRELVSVVQATLQTERLKIAAALPEVSILSSELQNFQVSISESGFDSYNARSGAHDDLVLAVAMAVWLGMNLPGGWGSRPLGL